MWSEKEKKNQDPSHVTKESYLEVEPPIPVVVNGSALE